jgi:hypothetical protein
MTDQVSLNNLMNTSPSKVYRFAIVELLHAQPVPSRRGGVHLDGKTLLYALLL